MKSWVKGLHTGRAWDAGTAYGCYTSGTVSVNDMCGLVVGLWEWRSGRGQEAAGRKRDICSENPYPSVGRGEQGRPS